MGGGDSAHLDMHGRNDHGRGSRYDDQHGRLRWRRPGELHRILRPRDRSRPRPTRLGKPGVADEKVEAKKNAGDQMQRQRELEKREEKRKMLATFVDENNVGVAEIQSAIEETAAMPAEQRKKGVDFGQFCKFNKVEPTGEYHRLFSLFDPYGKGTIDMKELALGMLNFVD